MSERIGFQGIAGAYSEQALLKHFGEGVESVGFESFDEVYDAVLSGAVEYGMVPVENTIAGTVVENVDLLLSKDVQIIAEAFLPIHHQLLVKSGVELGDVKRAISHPHALRQCKGFLKSHGIKAEPVYDTAGAAKMLSEMEDGSDVAAIASSLCESKYGLSVMGRDIETNDNNTTRFFVVVKNGRPVDIKEKTTIVFKTKNYPGALVDCLKVFQLHNLNMTKLESRPIPENPWEYVFYTDLDTMGNKEIFDKAVESLSNYALMVKVLGSYDKGK